MSAPYVREPGDWSDDFEHLSEDPGNAKPPRYEERPCFTSHSLHAVAAPPDWDRTNPGHKEHEPEPDEKEAPRKRGGRRARKEETPAVAKVKPLNSFVHTSTSRVHPPPDQCTTTVVCPACSKVFETFWPSKPDIEELRIERDRILKAHTPACKGRTPGGRRTR